MSVRKTPQRGSDWHPADIKAEVEKAGTSLRKLSVANGYNPHALKDVLRRSWPKGEEIVAGAIGRTPQEIWPSRYAKKAKRSAGAAGRAAA